MIKKVCILAFIAFVVAQTPLKPGVPFNGYTQFRSWSYFTIPASEDTINYVQLVANVDSGVPFFYLNIDSRPTFQDNIWKYENTTKGNVMQYIYNPNINLMTGNFTSGVFFMAVYGFSDTKYTITLNTQGPIMLYDRQILTPNFPVPDAYIFYKFIVDPDVRQFQIYAQEDAGSSSAFWIVARNATVGYPVVYNQRQYISSAYNTGSGWDSCLDVNYPYPGTYRLGLTVYELHYTIQFVQNNVGRCKN
jgi:hypothetical protein